MGFGGGALIASPLSNQLLARYDPSFHPAVPGSVASGQAVAMLFVTFAVLYGLMMSFGATTVRVPPPGWRPAGYDPAMAAAKPLVTTADVSAANAIRTPQFYLLWVVLFCNVTAGIGILEQAAPMSQDFFRGPAASPRSLPVRPPASSGCSRWPTWPAGSSGRQPPTTSAGAGSTCSTSAAASCCTPSWPPSGTSPWRCSCSSAA